MVAWSFNKNEYRFAKTLILMAVLTVMGTMMMSIHVM